VELTLAQLQEMGSVGFPGLLGIDFREAGDGFVRARLELEEKHMAPNGYLHAGTVVGFADSACGYGCILNLPDGATGTTTIESKTNFLGAVREGVATATARPLHAGSTTVVIETLVTDAHGGAVAKVTQTQLVLHQRQ
jgi:uncharacterized protein (TIGR00369 family)